MVNGAIGKRIAVIRDHRLMTQAALAHAVGVTRSVISNIERGITVLGAEDAERIAMALHCLHSDLLEPLEAQIPLVRYRGRFKLGAERPQPFWSVEAE
jgi:transcriptional regulator with XRE-family HTH domain